MKQIKSIQSHKILTRIVMAVLLLAILGGAMTSCASGGAKITTIKKGYTITDSMISDKNVMSALALDKMADEIAKSKSGFDIREQLVAALNGYDMTASDFDDAKVADGTLAAQPEKSAEFALNVLAKFGITAPDEKLVMTTADVELLVKCFQTKVETEAKLGVFDQLLHWIGIGFAWLIDVPGFGSFILGTLYFAIALEILMLPLGIHQQKNSRKQARLRPKEMAIRNKYKGRNDQATQQKLNQEIQDLYVKEGYSPMAGCLPLLLTLPFLFALYYVVIDPMTYIFGAPTGLTSAFLTFADAPRAAGGLGLALSSDRGTIEMLSLLRESGLSLDGLANFQYFSNSPECLAALDGLVESIPNFSLFGLNMGLTAGFGSKDQLVLLFMPVLTFIVYWASGKITRKFSFQPMQQAMPMPVFTEEEYKAAERELMGKEVKNKPVKREGGPRNPNVRSLHHIDDEDYESPAEREARLAARKRDYVEPEDETPAEPKVAEGAYGDGASLKEDDRPARKEKKNKKNRDD